MLFLRLLWGVACFCHNGSVCINILGLMPWYRRHAVGETIELTMPMSGVWLIRGLNCPTGF